MMYVLEVARPVEGARRTGIPRLGMQVVGRAVAASAWAVPQEHQGPRCGEPRVAAVSLQRPSGGSAHRWLCAGHAAEAEGDRERRFCCVAIMNIKSHAVCLFLLFKARVARINNTGDVSARSRKRWNRSVTQVYIDYCNTIFLGT